MTEAAEQAPQKYHLRVYGVEHTTSPDGATPDNPHLAVVDWCVLGDYAHWLVLRTEHQVVRSDWEPVT